jgi:hypothetical protein
VGEERQTFEDSRDGRALGCQYLQTVCCIGRKARGQEPDINTSVSLTSLVAYQDAIAYWGGVVFVKD